MYLQPKSSKDIFKKFLYCLRIVLTESEIFGFIHLTYTQNHFHLSKLNFFYSIVLILLYFTISFYIFFCNLFDKTLGMLHKVLILIINIFAGTYTITVGINNLLKRKKIAEYLNKIVEFDLKLQSETLLINYKKERKRSKINLITKCSILGFYLIYDFIIQKNVPRDSLADYLVYYFLGIFLIIFNSAVCYQATEFILLLKVRYKILNKQLVQIVNYFENNVYLVEKSLAVKEKSVIFSKICILHHHLFKLVKLFNEIFGPNLLQMFAVGFMNITQFMFLVCILLQSYQINWKNVFYIITLSIVYAFEIFYICRICSSTIQEVVFNFFL